MAELEILIADIIAKEMGLNLVSVVSPTLDNFVIIQNQSFIMPNTAGLKIIVSSADGQVYNTRSYFDTVTVDDEEIYTEFQETRVRENISINIYSRDNSARTRRFEVLQSLSSLYANQQQEKYNFQIAKIPTSFMNISGAEGSTTLNRFSIVIPCLFCYTINKNRTEKTDYFNDFAIKLYNNGLQINTDTPFAIIEETEE